MAQAPRIIIQVLYPMSYLATVFEPVLPSHFCPTDEQPRLNRSFLWQELTFLSSKGWRWLKSNEMGGLTESLVRCFTKGAALPTKLSGAGDQMHLTITKETVMFASDFIFFLFLFDISTKESNVKVLHPFLPSLSHQQMFAL